MNARDPHEDIRRKALLAASTVALAFQVGACARYGTTTLPVDTDPTDVDSDTVVAETDPTDVALRPDCSNDPNANASPGCCDDLRAWCAVEYPGDLDAENTCIFGPNYDTSTGCIPWGPPSPPAARRRLA